MNGWLGRYRGHLLTHVAYWMAMGGLVFFLRQPEREPLRVLPPVPTPTATAVPCQVYVTGAVLSPGTVGLTGQDPRVEDALTAAGDWAVDADREGINLAQPVRDGDHIHVPRIGESASGSDGVATDRVSINTADVASLMALPGIGETYAQRIIDYRERNGPFQTAEEIQEVEGIGEKIFEEIRDRILVR